MRAIAVFLVLGHHAAWRFPPSSEDFFGQILKYAGWIGVDIFFVISGFMITGILVRDSGRGDIRGFFVRRFYRIVPLSLLAVGLFACVSIVTGSDIEKLPYLWSPALLLNGWVIPFIGRDIVPFTITWSLSVEETAYILLGISCLLAPAGLGRMLVAFLVIAIAVRIAVVVTGAFDLYDLYFFVPARLDTIALGGFGALGFYRGLLGHRGVGFLAGIVTFGLIWVFQYTPLEDPVMPLLGYLVFGFFTALFITSLSNSDKLFPLHPMLARVTDVIPSFGRLSYFIYLFHLFVLEGLLFLQRLAPGLEMGYWTAVGITCVTTFALASLSWRYFETPLIRKSKQRGRTPVARFDVEKS